MDRKPQSGLAPLNTASTLLEAQSTLNLQQLEWLKEANDAANRVVKGTVDFDKCTPELLALVTEYLASLPPQMMRRVTCLDEGILLKSKFMPTVADFHALVLELEEKDDRFKPSRSHYRYFEPSPEPPPKPLDDGGVPGFHCPYPKLAKCFEDELNLLRGRNFDDLTAASRAVAMYGKEAARRVLNVG